MRASRHMTNSGATRGHIPFGNRRGAVAPTNTQLHAGTGACRKGESMEP